MKSQDFINIKKNIKNRIHQDIQHWTKHQVIKLLQILNVDKYLKHFFQNIQIDGQKLFTQKYGMKYIQKLFQKQINQNNYLPIKKLLIVVEQIIKNTNHQKSYMQSQNLKLSVYGLQNYQFSQFQEKLKQTHFGSKVIQKLSIQFDKNNIKNIAELTQNEIKNIIVNIKCQKYNRVIQNYHPDGFALIYTLTNNNIMKDMKNRFSQQDLNLLEELSQILRNQQKIVDQQQLPSSLSKQNTQQSITDKYPYQVMEIISDDWQQEQKNNQQDLNIEENEQNQKHQQNQQTLDKHLSLILCDNANNNKQTNNRPVSSIQNPNLLKSLQQISLQLPFNLLILEPLRQIKVTQLYNPFAKKLQKISKASSSQQIQKNCYLISKNLSCKGARFGRQKNYQFYFKQQPSISASHAKIYFNEGQFFLQDLGSKTGTFIRIQNQMIIQNEAIIQLSYEVQIIFKILKKQQKEAVIKIQFIKPESLKECIISIKRGKPIKIGRQVNSDIKIDQKKTKVSLKHAYILYKGQNFFFIDRNSRGGSWLRLSNKKTTIDTSEGYKLSLGDIFRISTKISFIIEQTKSMIKQLNQEKNYSILNDSKQI